MRNLNGSKGCNAIVHGCFKHWSVLEISIITSDLFVKTVAPGVRLILYCRNSLCDSMVTDFAVLNNLLFVLSVSCNSDVCAHNCYVL
jgi:hypothetical protein